MAIVNFENTSLSLFLQFDFVRRLEHTVLSPSYSHTVFISILWGLYYTFLIYFLIISLSASITNCRMSSSTSNNVGHVRESWMKIF